jgi:putative transposase
MRRQIFLSGICRFDPTDFQIEIVKCLATAVRFRLQPKRWVVERSFAWLGNARRLSKDHELDVKTNAVMVYATISRLMLRSVIA